MNSAQLQKLLTSAASPLMIPERDASETGHSDACEELPVNIRVLLDVGCILEARDRNHVAQHLRREAAAVERFLEPCGCFGKQPAGSSKLTAAAAAA